MIDKRLCYCILFTLVNSLTDEDTHTLTLHRSTIRSDLVKYFKDLSQPHSKKLQFIILDPRGIPEEGVGVGVTRDVYSAFWKEVGDGFLIGEGERVPFVRHDLYIGDWEAMAKVLLRGYRDVQYFPVILSKSFMQFVMLEEVEDAILKEGFLNYVPHGDRKIIEKFMKGVLDEEELDEVMDVFDTYHCKSKLTSDSVDRICVEMGRQELIQKPHLMALAWRNVLQKQLENDGNFNSSSSINHFYKQSEPTPRRVARLFTAQPQSPEQVATFDYLKKFTRACDSNNLKRFLRFLTSADIMLVDSIEVNFIGSFSDFSKRPMCGEF